MAPERPPTSAPPTGRLDLLDPSSLSQLGGMEFIAREVVEGFLIGLHRSPHRGFSAVFSIRQGDELWRPLVAITLLLLESIIAASGATQASPSWTQRTGAAPTAPLSVS